MQIVEAKRKLNGYLYFKILVNPKAEKENRTYEEFTWGADVDEKTALREMKLLLKEKYGKKTEEVLSSEGKTL